VLKLYAIHREQALLIDIMFRDVPGSTKKAPKKKFRKKSPDAKESEGMEARVARRVREFTKTFGYPPPPVSIASLRGLVSRFVQRHVKDDPRGTEFS
jgi:hypothetical protein